MAQRDYTQTIEGYPRSLPRSTETEQVVLGSALLEPERVLSVLLDQLRPEHFYAQSHRIIFRVIYELAERSEPADIIAVANRLEEKDELVKIGGRAYLNELLDRVATTASLDYYVKIVKKKALLRALVESGTRISELGYDEEHDIDETLDRAESIIFDLSQRDSIDSYYHLKDFLGSHIEDLERLHSDPDRRTLTGVSTGFAKFDEMTSGLRDSDLIVVAGRPGTGKTSFALSLIRNIAIRGKASVGVFSLEMTKEQLLERLLCGEAKVSLHRLRGGFVPVGKWRDIAMAAGRFQDSNIIVDDSPGISIMEIRARARRMASEYGLGLIVVDYIQLVEGGIRTDVREQEIAYISRSLKKLARELNVPVIAISQLSRAVERRPGKKIPQLADLRESGAIEQDSDIVIFIYRKDYYDEPEEEPQTSGQSIVSEAEIIIAKQRNGPLGKFILHFHKGYASFYQPTYDREPAS